MPKPRTFINIEELSNSWSIANPRIAKEITEGNYASSRHFELEIALAQAQQLTVVSHGIKELCKMMAELTLAVQRQADVVGRAITSLKPNV